MVQGLHALAALSAGDNISKAKTLYECAKKLKSLYKKNLYYKSGNDIANKLMLLPTSIDLEKAISKKSRKKALAAYNAIYHQ